jgi:Ca2+-binding RTX toxin-like protein
VDLSAGAFSDVGGFRGNLSIALGVVIEDAVGGRGADRILGNAADNRLRGAAGADHVAGGAGNDLLTGNAGADRFIFGAGDGRDRITDFTQGQDRLLLSDDLWGGGAMTAGAVLDEFASLRRGGVVLDFGVEEIALAGVTQIAGLEGSLLIF